MDLQNTFYVLGIITMALGLIMLLAIVTAVLVIRAKIIAIHQMIDDKLSLVTNLSAAGSNVLKSVKQAVSKSK